MTTKKSTEAKTEPKTTDSVAVFLSQKMVGVLTRYGGDQHIFEIEKDYEWTNGDPIMTIGMRQRDGRMSHSPMMSRTRLPAFFSNLLPEGSLREYLAAQAGVKPQREFSLLRALADDLPGAIILQPIENGIATAPPPLVFSNSTITHRESDVLRFSIAGVQLKFSAIQNSSGGLTIPANGAGGSYIVKLPSTRFSNVPENEYSMMELARRMGMQVAEVELKETNSISGLPENLPENFGQSLVVKRFDRSTNRRIHMEDFAQVFKLYPEEKYKKISYGNIGSVLWNESDVEQLQEFVKRLTYSLLIGNADMHAKNWSLLYLDPQKPILSPAYDFISTISYLPDYQMGLSIAGEKAMYGIEMDNFRRMAVKAKLPEALVVRTVEQTVELFHQYWPKAKESLPIDIFSIEKIESHLKKLPIYGANG